MESTDMFEQTKDPAKRFEFGKNWQSFLRASLSQERIGKARADLLTFLGRDDLRGLRFLDVGSGSGLHSLGAYDAGASPVVSFDYDENSVAATAFLRGTRGAPAHWQVMRGSILDGDFLATLGRYDIVYSWGVLHHTGDVRAALRNASRLVAPGGLFYVALYDGDCCAVSPQFWLDVKQRYLAAGFLGKRAMELWYVWRFSLGRKLTRLPELMRTARDYKKHRGMSYYFDVKDWLGGWPMEFTTVDDVLPGMQALGFDLMNINTGEANTEYLFRAAGQPAVATRHSVLLDTAAGFVRNMATLQDVAELSQFQGAAPVYIYGAGKAGDILYRQFLAAGIRPAGFVTTRENGSHNGLPMVAVADFRQSADADARVVIASSRFMDISFELARHGISRFWNAYPLILRSL
jgi:SAM-dependent methyltransferase